MKLLHQIKSVLFGVAVGDAIGVPIEFLDRATIGLNPMKDMIGHGTHNQLPGTFSDDASLTFCLAEALTQPFDVATIGSNFVQWYNDNYWTARGVVFDVGIATREAINRIADGERADLAGDFDVSSNGNGSLMRIAPLTFFIADKPITERFALTKLVSSITHAHIRSVVACFYYLEFARQLLTGKDKIESYETVKTVVTDHLLSLSINPAEVALFDRLLKGNIYDVPENGIASSGYVLHTLEASIWSLMTTNTYSEAVLKAVNLGEDTDTTGAVTGGLAGLLYGIDTMPEHWLAQLARHDDINDLSERLATRLSQ